MSDRQTPENPDENPFIVSFFEWRDNTVDENLRTVYRGDSSQRVTLVGIARDLEDSPTYWRLMAKLTDALDEARKQSPHAEGKVLLAFAARLYAAGSGAISEVETM